MEKPYSDSCAHFNRVLGSNSAMFALSNTLFQEQSYGNYQEYVTAHHE